MLFMLLLLVSASFFFACVLIQRFIFFSEMYNSAAIPYNIKNMDCWKIVNGRIRVNILDCHVILSVSLL